MKVSIAQALGSTVGLASCSILVCQAFVNQFLTLLKELSDFQACPLDLMTFY